MDLLRDPRDEVKGLQIMLAELHRQVERMGNCSLSDAERAGARLIAQGLTEAAVTRLQTFRREL